MEETKNNMPDKDNEEPVVAPSKSSKSSVRNSIAVFEKLGASSPQKKKPVVTSMRSNKEERANAEHDMTKGATATVAQQQPQTPSIEDGTDDCGATVHSEDTVKTSSCVGENNKRYSAAAQELLSKESQDDPEALLESLKQEDDQAKKDNEPVMEQPTTTTAAIETNCCDELVLGICNGLADQTLYACCMIMECLEGPPRKKEFDDDDDDDSTKCEESTDLVLPNKEESFLEMEPVPQVVRKGHELQSIVQEQ